MKNKNKGFSSAGLIVTIVALILIVIGVSFYQSDKNRVVDVMVNDSPVSTTTASIQSLTDLQFIGVSDDPQAKVVARGDINMDGFEDAIVQEIYCGASCSISLQVVLNEQNKNARNYPYTFAPAYMSSSAAKSQVTQIEIKDGIISLTGRGLACTTPNSEEPCTQEKWGVVKTVRYKFDGTNIIQLSVEVLPTSN